MDDLISAGLINENELIILQELEKKFPVELLIMKGYRKNWLPICWAANVVTRADGRIKDDFALETFRIGNFVEDAVN